MRASTARASQRGAVENERSALRQSLSHLGAPLGYLVQ